MPECLECGGHVTPDFVRIFGVDGDVHACPACTSYSELQEGAAAQLGKRP